MEIGKISNSDLEKYVFKNLKYKRREVLIKSSVGVDTSVLDLEGDLVVVSTDPITATTENLGSLAVNISVNDVACEGAQPVGLLLSILLPPSATIEELNEIMTDANDACNALDLDIIGGHTEVTDAVNRIVVTTTVIARTNPNALPGKRKIKSGDILALSKELAIEGVSIIASEKEDELKDVLTAEELKFSLEQKSRLSVLKEALTASKHGVKKMHDITEGGVYGAAWEMAQAMGKSIVLDRENIPVMEVTKKICNHFGLDPMRLISSGSMLMIFSPEDFSEFQDEMKNEGILVSAIGVVHEGSGVYLDEDFSEEISAPASDELYKLD